MNKEEAITQVKKTGSRTYHITEVVNIQTMSDDKVAATNVESVEEQEKGPSASATFLSDITGSPVIVKLYSGEEYHGRLDTIDGYMNITLEETREKVSGKVTNTYGDLFIRGNNVLYISEA